MAQKTAIQWLQEKYNEGNEYERHLTESEFEQAKAMEKKQIMQSWDAGYGSNDIDEIYEINESLFNANDYYNETYKK
jgi:hypothetical protein